MKRDKLKQIIKPLVMLLMTMPLKATISFMHHDWQIECDNTNTCRIAGYSPLDKDDTGISILCTRKAGINQSTKCEIQLQAYEKQLKKFPAEFNLQMTINDVNHGFVKMNKNDLIASLSKEQTDALLASLYKNSKFLWKADNLTWELSDKGMSAVVLKMNEFQKRLKSDKKPLSPKAKPIIYAEKISSYKEIRLSSEYMSILKKELLLEKGVCFVNEEDRKETSIYELSSDKVLASKLCWNAAYNRGYVYWIINKKPPFNPKIITTNGGDFDVDKRGVGNISYGHKGRGVGDCWSFKNWVWDGKSFQHSYEATTGLCRGFAGGAWTLPTFVSKIEVK